MPDSIHATAVQSQQEADLGAINSTFSTDKELSEGARKGLALPGSLGRLPKNHTAHAAAQPNVIMVKMHVRKPGGGLVAIPKAAQERAVEQAPEFRQTNGQFEPIFDGEDEIRFSPGTGAMPSLLTERARSVVRFALGVERAARGGGDARLAIHNHVKGLRRNHSRLLALFQRVASEAVPTDTIFDAGGDERPRKGDNCTWGEWRAAARLARGVILSTLLNVRPRTKADLLTLLDLVVRFGTSDLPKARANQIASRLSATLADVAAGRGIKGGVPKLWTYHNRYQIDRMSPLYPEGSQLMMVLCRTITPGQEYVFKFGTGFYLGKITNVTALNYMIANPSRDWRPEPWPKSEVRPAFRVVGWMKPEQLTRA